MGESGSGISLERLVLEEPSLIDRFSAVHEQRVS